MKKLLLVFIVSGTTSCSNPTGDLNNNTTQNNYKSYIKIQNHEISKAILYNHKTRNIIYDIEGLTPYNKSNQSEIIKSDFKFNVESYNDLKIDKVKLSETGQQVDVNGTESITSDYSKSKKLNLTIEGNFTRDFQENKFFFINEPDLLHLSYIGEPELKTTVLIDDSIVLNPISASDKYINISIDTKNVPDFYLKGLHKLKIINDNKSVNTFIRFGEPVKPETSLVPVITKIELLKKNNENNPKVMALKLTGKNFMINPQFYYTKVDGVFSKGFQTDVIKTSNGDIFETVVNISTQTNFLTKQSHVIEFYTPYGMFYSEFKV